MTVQDITVVQSLADLKAKPPGENTIVLLVGRVTMGDGLGAFFWWDATATDAIDNAYLNVVTSDMSTTGRWRKLNVKTLTLPHGTLVMNAGKKEFYYAGVIDANSTCVVNLTYENTATGTPIFTDVWFDDSIANINATSVTDAVSSYRKSLTADLKVLTHGFYRGTSTNLGLTLTAILGLIIPSFRAAAPGTPVKFKVEGS